MYKSLFRVTKMTHYLHEIHRNNGQETVNIRYTHKRGSDTERISKRITTQPFIWKIKTTSDYIVQ